MKIAKTILKTGLAASALLFGAGALVYEGALNTKINAFFINKFDKPATEQTALYQGDAYSSAQQWFRAHRGKDHVITSEKTGRTHAYIFEAEKPTHRWVILCHGYNSSTLGTAAFTKHFYEQGCNCVCPSMRGWDMDENRYCSMGWRDQDILLAWIDYVILMDPEAQIVLHGYSMGAVTTMLATGHALPKNVKAAIADCGFTTCWEQFAGVMKQYAHLPSFPLLNVVNLISRLRGNFDARLDRPIDAIRRSETPTVFLHGTADDFIPCRMMDELYEACAAPKARQPIEGGFHATSVLKNPELYWKAVDGFLAEKITA